MASLGNSSRLRTNCRMMLMRDKAFQEEQRKRQKMSSPRGHNASRNHPLMNPNSIGNGHAGNSILFKGIINHNNNNTDMLSLGHLEPIPGEDLAPLDSPYSLTPSSMTTSISEYEAFIEDINEIVEKESHHPATFANISSISEKDYKAIKTEEPSKPPLKTSSSCPTMRASRLTLPSKLDPSDFPDIDAYKKEKHNIVEKKRRYKINDCIQELADLLPTSYDVDLNMKKGYILEKSVEYIQELKKESEKKSEIERRFKDMERENRQLQLELQAMKRSQDAALQQQQQHQFLLVSSPFPQQQQRLQQVSPQQNQIVLALGNDLDNANIADRHDYGIDDSIFMDDYSTHEVDILEPVIVRRGNVADADTLMSNLQVSNELTETDRRELNGFIDLDDFCGDDLMMSNDFAFHNPHNQY